MSPGRQQIEISKCALLQRLDRKLRKQGKKLGTRNGLHFIASEKWVEPLNQGLESLARELGALRPWEKVA
jgi:hypothetical protein